jgi:hypothetical protein
VRKGTWKQTRTQVEVAEEGSRHVIWIGWWHLSS